jgi:cyanophycinase
MTGPLLLIGGSEDRHDAMQVLERFVQLAGGVGSDIAVITAASKHGERVWHNYDAAFAALGVARRAAVHVPVRAAANDPALARRVAAADGILMTGGDQTRLMELVGGTALAQAMHGARERGACVAGTSAGASAMSACMLAPADHGPHVRGGLGFVHGVIVDQHFSQRRRLARLLAVVRQYPQLIGVGIDEDTALLIEADTAIEVIGAGGVTIAQPAAVESAPPKLLQVLPAGERHALAERNLRPAALADFLHIATRTAHHENH